MCWSINGFVRVWPATYHVFFVFFVSSHVSSHVDYDVLNMYFNTWPIIYINVYPQPSMYPTMHCGLVQALQIFTAELQGREQGVPEII